MSDLFIGGKLEEERVNQIINNRNEYPNFELFWWWILVIGTIVISAGCLFFMLL